MDQNKRVDKLFEEANNLPDVPEPDVYNDCLNTKIEKDGEPDIKNETSFVTLKLTSTIK